MRSNDNQARVIQERNSGNTTTVSYTRGTDLSGSMEGAGGIGGLLARSHAYQSGSGAFTNHNYYFADGNGNISYLETAGQGLGAWYSYDPFGNQEYALGHLAAANKYRFSSKEIVMENSNDFPLYYYGYRFYAPYLQRWLNRDPLGELGFEAMRNKVPLQMRQFFIANELFGQVNRYEYVKNDPIKHWDSLGLMPGVPPNYHPPKPPPAPPSKPCKRDCADEENWCNVRGVLFCGLLIEDPPAAAFCTAIYMRACHIDEQACEEENKRNGY